MPDFTARLNAIRRMIEGEHASDIAAEMGIPSSTVRNWKLRSKWKTPVKELNQPRLRRCRNSRCEERFLPLNPQHWYHEPACRAEKSSKLTVKEVLTDEAGLDGPSGHLELAKSAFAQKNVALRRVASLRAMRDYMSSEVKSFHDENPEFRYRMLPWASEHPGPSKKDAREIVVLASDWQIGKLDSGIGITEMRDHRLPRFQDAIEGIVSHFRDSGYSVPRIHLVFAGDMIEGCWIYGGQNVNGLDRTGNTHRITTQIGVAANMEASLAASLSGLVDEVIVHSVPGNHGRTNGRNEFSDPEDNFDTMVARWAQDKTSQIPSIKWSIIDEWFGSFTVTNHEVVVLHGDQWRGPVWRLDDLLPRYINSGAFTKPSLLLCGHRHDFAAFRVGGTTVVQNGTIDGGSNWYLRAYGKASTPTQTVVVMSERFGVEAIYPIYVAER